MLPNAHNLARILIPMLALVFSVASLRGAAAQQPDDDSRELWHLVAMSNLVVEAQVGSIDDRRESLGTVILTLKDYIR